MKLTRLKQLLRRPFNFKFKDENEPTIPKRHAIINRRALRKQAILNLGISIANGQAIRRRIERAEHGHLITPLHQP